MLVELFPDACILFTHRNPLEILPSYCSMMAMLRAVRSAFDPKALGGAVLEYLARSLERALAARDRMDPARVFDVDYRAFVADPLATARQVYRHFELPLDAASEAALERHVRENPQGKHGAHRYALEEYGLDPARVRERLRFYTDRFEVPTA